MERGIAAGLLAMEMGIDEILYGKVRVLGDGCLDLVMQWRELGVHHLMPSSPITTRICWARLGRHAFRNS
jgi:hypothetical protein